MTRPDSCVIAQFRKQLCGPAADPARTQHNDSCLRDLPRRDRIPKLAGLLARVLRNMPLLAENAKDDILHHFRSLLARCEPNGRNTLGKLRRSIPSTPAPK